jgi:glycosyltransferase involved in cell wall biosynthesis
VKVLIVSNGFPPRGGFGTEFYTRELVLGLRGRGHAVRVVHPVHGQRTEHGLEDVLEGGVPVTLVHAPRDPTKGFERSYRDRQVEELFAGLLERERPDLVHFTYLLWGLSVGLPELARQRGVPSLATLTDYGLLCHRGQMFDASLERCFGPHPPARCARCIREPAPFDHGPLERTVRRGLVRALAVVGGLGRVVVPRDVERREAAVLAARDALVRLVAPTASLRRVFEEAGWPRERFTTLCYAFDERPYAAQREAPPPPTVRLGFLGQFAPHKGLGTLLEAVRRLAARTVDVPWELVLHGGPSPGRHRHYASHVLPGADPRRVRVEAPFPPDEAARVLAGFSALVAPSEWDENAPLAVLQARAAGLPVIATDVPGIAEVVPAEAGRLVPVGDAGALADALEEVVRGRLCRPAAPGLPTSLEEHLTRIEVLYDEVVAEGSA